MRARSGRMEANQQDPSDTDADADEQLDADDNPATNWQEQDELDIAPADFELEYDASAEETQQRASAESFAVLSGGSWSSPMPQSSESHRGDRCMGSVSEPDSPDSQLPHSQQKQQPG
ncbi:MAG: hypothetical protein EOO38_29845 [Cytophagaceae bacterium]|nr:MAG: hypothetical protein EOO38_29845 [Cytophagaceae bacterium]